MAINSASPNQGIIFGLSIYQRLIGAVSDTRWQALLETWVTFSNLSSSLINTNSLYLMPFLLRAVNAFHFILPFSFLSCISNLILVKEAEIVQPGASIVSGKIISLICHIASNWGGVCARIGS